MKKPTIKSLASEVKDLRGEVVAMKIARTGLKKRLDELEAKTAAPGHPYPNEPKPYPGWPTQPQPSWPAQPYQPAPPPYPVPWCHVGAPRMEIWNPEATAKIVQLPNEAWRHH
jgi:hypothetical protein